MAAADPLPSDLARLFSELVEGTLTDEGFAELDARLAADPEARRLYARYVELHDALGRRWANAPPATSPALRVASRSPARVIATGLAGVAAAVVVAVLLPPAGPPPDVATEPPAAPHATLVAARDAVWADPNVDQALSAGQLPGVGLRLESGTAEFLLADGATVVARGPAVVRFPARGRVAVDLGRVFCRCPTPASRVVVETPAGEVIDLGTEFAVESRPDRTARVAVVSGEVRVGSASGPSLRKGQSAEVRADGLLVVRAITAAELAELCGAAPSAEAPGHAGDNLLLDPGFDRGLATETWGGTEGHLSPDPGGRTGPGLRVSARGFASFPLCRQRVRTGDLGGKLLVASVWAATPADDPISPGQFAGLKVVFLDGNDREFGFVKQHLLTGRPVPGRFEQVRLAAIAPPRTAAVSVQLILYAARRDAGAVVFDAAALSVADVPPAP
ncbi:FecR protein OS=Planctomyces brasiliensis (strain ATCC 49424 / DSM 5305 / JCM 21570 / NBRC 103401 / IFAM 1448) GN=Plabr_2988 PE=4 SV=1: FecR [Gemmataceae bacterium]|nr:FecR protein OS=Planctomyces brasiliensis (strain ATCC 49424 / DSM 5305 / JCM 21570 / NBRC 103401 / IFAM 1448) GN=Plabr_2988 PE=4 SV=1: FecR [Gemmataceae bacterium]VTT96475.1 FecR protein OS=Planctomyces brasiliensis (strain ATCC 49424 / DSM 5305 / JCM 21570 / NBRC 103401 / IFAM 1448) GN=Plabr_2988 PE=4 SV=1: FecR [Gemmataceae bacterium]